MNILNILYQSNDYYSVVTGVSMTSLCENNKHIGQINFFILNDSISAANIAKMQQVCDTYKRNLILVDTQAILQRLLDLKVAPFKNTYTTYFKLMALKDLEVPGGRIFQLDGDTVINGSLSELIDIDLTGYILAATYDCTMNKYKSLIDIPETDKYYNGGVLLINQDMWRSEHCEERIVDHLKNVRNGYYTVDQDILNVLFRDKIKYLDLKYNFNSGFYIYGIKESLKMYGLREPYYNSVSEIQTAYDHPVIYHCMGAMTGRPWEKDSIHPQNDIFDRYLALSPWKDFEKATIARKRIFRIQRRLYQILPRSMYIPLHMIAQKRYLTAMNKAVHG